MYQEITIQFTENCNLHCPYCFAPQGEGGNISLHDFERFLNFCKRTHPDCIHVTGGEPLLHPQFSMMIERLADIAPLVIYSNLTLPEKFNHIFVRNPEDIFILANYNGKEFYTDSQWDAFQQNIRNAKAMGVKIALGLTIYRLPFADRFKEALGQIRKNQITHLRISQAMENSNKQHGLDRDSIQQLYAFVAKHIAQWKVEGIKTYFDCPVPPCYMDTETFHILQNYDAVGITCKPKAFIQYDLGITHCYSTIGYGEKRKLCEFNTISGITEYSKSKIQSMCKGRDITPCLHCEVFQGDLPCGCPAYGKNIQ